MTGRYVGARRCLPAIVVRPFIFLLTSFLQASAAGTAKPVDFAQDVYPILRKTCFECHGAKQQKAGLRLDSLAAIRRGSRGGPILVPGQADQSEIVRRVILPGGDEEIMPPRGQPLGRVQVGLIRDWINQGARGQEITAAKHWAYVRPVRPGLPSVRDTAWPRNGVDRFILARLERAGLRPAGQATAATRVRRVYLDLIGLPPAPADVEAFLADPSAAAYERLVDRLLASPQFGERWARPWLDYGRYADSHGFQKDDFRDLWPYRDWVVQALNADMPFDRFTIEQIAGDLLPNATVAQKIATGFNRSAPTNVEAGSDPEETRVNQVLDRVNTVATVWLGSTLECVQCHDHKYDPFTMRDYYGLFAFFNNTALEAERADPKIPGSIKFQGPALTLPDKKLENEQKSLQTRLDEAKHRLAAAAPGPAKQQLRREVKGLTAEIKALELPSTLVMQELPRPRASTMFRRGNFRTPADPVVPGVPAVLHALDVPVPQRDRLALARWLVGRDNPLVARVTVNHWWAELFGHGLVRTPEDFGLRGEPPTHPELLDWLAVEFLDSGWSMKKLLRTIVTSATYQQASKLTSELQARDDQNLLYARGPRFRLDAEMIRDNALAIAGLLSPVQGGPPIRPYQPAGLWVKVGGLRYEYIVSPGQEKYRRGLYVVWKRGAPYPSFVNFDANSRMTCRVARPRSNTPLQALTLLNDPVYVEAALAFAGRVLHERPAGSVNERLGYAFRLAVARAPRPTEIATLKNLFEQERLAGSRNRTAAKQLVGTYPLPPDVSAEEFAAWYAVAAALLNLDETMSKG